MNSSSMDYNINNYTIPELFTILGIDEEPDEQQIINKTNNYIDNTNSSPQISTFFQQIQDTLLSYMADNDNDSDNDSDNDNEDEDEDEDDTQDNTRRPMKQEQIGVINTKSPDVSQGILNPNLKNITTRIINLDSRFRQSGGLHAGPTNYTLDLSAQLNDIISLRLYSFQIPFTWYVIDNQYGNTCFWVTNNGNDFKIYIEPGNYTPTTLCAAINDAFTNSSNFTMNIQPFTWNGTGTVPDIATFNPNNGKITINLSQTFDINDNIDTYWTDPDGTVITAINDDGINDDGNINAYLTFFDFDGHLNLVDTSSVKSMSFDGTLGWLMGYRIPVMPIYIGGNYALAVLDLYGSKYFILVIDDYNQNHINNGLVTIAELSKQIPLPNYYNPTAPRNCPAPTTRAENIKNIDADINTLGNDIHYTKFPQILPTAPRTLTKAQIYTINQIIQNKHKNASYRSKAPTTSDTFAILPIKRNNLTTGGMYVEFSGALQDNKRIYFGPVDIDRMTIKLLDDRGFVVDLHGVDWCVTLISENLYQY